MGCDISSEPEALNPKITPAKRNVSDPQKNKLIQYIEKDNLLMFASVMEE